MKNRPFAERLKAALSGLAAAWKTERSLRTQSLFALAAFAALPLLRPALIWWALVGLMVILVLAAELFNTALEHLADHLHPERHPRIRMVKDCAAGAVLLLCLASLWVAALMVLSVL